MTKEKISGIVEAVSQLHEFKGTQQGGIKIDERWFNYDLKMDRFCSQIKKLDLVELDVEGKNIVFCKKTSSEPPGVSMENIGVSVEERLKKLEQEVMALKLNYKGDNQKELF